MIEVKKRNKQVIETQIAVANANLCEKMCDMRTLLKYAKNASISEICVNRIFA